jgi:hypothetical protein
LLPSSVWLLLNASLIAALFIPYCSCLQEFWLNMFVIAISRLKPTAYAPEVHRFSKVLRARKVTRSMFHVEDPRNIRWNSRNLVVQVTWHLAFLRPYYLVYRTAINTELHGDKLIVSDVPKYKQLVVLVSCKNENELFLLSVCVFYVIFYFIFILFIYFQLLYSHTPAVTVSMCCQHCDALQTQHVG